MLDDIDENYSSITILQKGKIPFKQKKFVALRPQIHLGAATFYWISSQVSVTCLKT